MERLLKIKFWIWFVPLAVISMVFFAFAGYAIRLSPLPMLLVASFGLITAYTAVGVAIGLGAKFSRFDWEYSTQLAASFGSVFYMLTTVASIALSGFILLPLTFKANQIPSISIRGYCILCGCFLLAWLPAILAVKLSCRAGLAELRERNR